MIERISPNQLNVVEINPPRQRILAQRRRKIDNTYYIERDYSIAPTFWVRTIWTGINTITGFTNPADNYTSERDLLRLEPATFPEEGRAMSFPKPIPQLDFTQSGFLTLTRFEDDPVTKKRVAVTDTVEIDPTESPKKLALRVLQEQHTLTEDDPIGAVRILTTDGTSTYIQLNPHLAKKTEVTIDSITRRSDGSVLFNSLDTSTVLVVHASNEPQAIRLIGTKKEGIDTRVPLDITILQVEPDEKKIIHTRCKIAQKEKLVKTRAESQPKVTAPNNIEGTSPESPGQIGVDVMDHDDPRQFDVPPTKPASTYVPFEAATRVLAENERKATSSGLQGLLKKLRTPKIGSAWRSLLKSINDDRNDSTGI